MSELTFGEEAQSLISAYSDLLVQAGEAGIEAESEHAEPDRHAMVEAIEVGNRLVELLTSRAEEYRESVDALRRRLERSAE
ncbi:putative ATP-grasp superfamily ATP-dependent carboligase [Actinoalloteichus hoggarensis]|uniref:Uncharacterized protein n=1 Tax=Actinoalloteichus hoggarensis TaxID=1470176 RepID=A0A221VXF3_9PSEU|nr:hypothetical protein [Actinoalloteichus hoggarensis]ASO18222.1 hypothetical protein AHOG_02810 [Actinoalloteichus hoggarensis]MBB5921579.1 putative ATP-grasp superfamily ATP-dependent carboligase [Actinoalloteichus hoggarensis]